MRALKSAALALGLGWLTGTQAQEPAQERPGPDLDFLEYLGTWAEEDDEWLVIEEWERDNGAAPDEERRGESKGPELPEEDDDEGE